MKMFKELFNKENFVTPSLDGNKKKHSYVVGALVCLLFVISSFTFMSFLYCFSDIVGSIVSGSADVAIHDALRSVPIFLTFFETLWILLLVHNMYRAESEEIVNKKYKKCLITSLVFACLTIIYVIVGRISGTYLSLVEGSPSPIFPLDSILYSLLFVLIAICGLFFKDKLPSCFHFELSERTPVVRKARFIYCFFVTIWMLMALFTFTAFLTGLFIIDFKHEWSFYGFGTLLAYLVTFLSFATWEFYYNELKSDAKAKCLLPLSIIGLIVCIIAIVIYFVSLSTNLDAPSNMGFGVFPVAFSAQVNIATMLVVFTPLIASVTALIKGLLLKLKAKKTNEE